MKARRCAVLVLLSAVSGCISTEPISEPVAAPSHERPAKPSQDVRSGAGKYSDPLVQNTYDTAALLCQHDGPAALAKEFKVGDTSDLDRIARFYSMNSVERAGHRDASYAGCLKGLMLFRSGKSSR